MLDELMRVGGLLEGEASEVLMEVSGLLEREALRVLGEIILVEGHRSGGFVDVLHGATGISLVAPNGDGAVAAEDLDEIVAMVRHRHELG